MLGSPWTLAGQQLILTNWFPNSDPLEAFIAQAPMWVMLPGLPIEYWTIDLLRRITSPIGVLMRLERSYFIAG